MIIKIRSVLIALLFACQLFCQKIPIIIDADTANEVDDLFAISGALFEPNFEILGVTSSQFNTSPYASLNTSKESKIINDMILKITGNTLTPSIEGGSKPINNTSNVVNSQASTFIIDKARYHSIENPLHIVILGSCTNIATAIINAPDITKNIKVFYLGFWHNPLTNSYNKDEFNSNNDPLAVNYLLDTVDLDFTVMSASTSQNLIFYRKELDKYFSINNPLGNYLKDRWDNYNRWWTDMDKENEQWIMWDVAIIEAIANKSLSKLEIFSTPPENLKRNIRVFTKIDVEKIKKRFWKKIQLSNTPNL